MESVVLLSCTSLPAGNRQFVNPFNNGEIVKLIPEQVDSKKRQTLFDVSFIKVYRMKYKETHVLRRAYFTNVKDLKKKTIKN
jgi:hypothetical protein